MISREERTRDNFETVYKVYHSAEYGFAGNTTILIAVEEETEDRIEGRRYYTKSDWPQEKIIIQKDNVAGWEEDNNEYRGIPETVSTPSAESTHKG